MVKITNGANVFEVTSGAYETIYKRQGYRKVEENAVEQPQEPQVPQKTADELFLEEVIEKPIASWSKNDVKKFAELKEIDLAGTKSADEAKERIKAFIDAQDQG